MRKKCSPDFVGANGLCNPFTNTKKWTITCGECRHTWKEKIPLAELVSALCPCCLVQNTWSAADFFDQYNDFIERTK